MKKGNNVLIIVIIVVLLVALLAGGFIYIFFATDILKSDEKLFYKYLAQIVSEEDGFVEQNIEKLKDKKKQNPYENSGSLTIQTELPKDMEDLANEVNELTFKFSGKTDNVNKKTEKEFIVDYGNDVTFPVIYKHIDKTFGLQIKPIGSNKFIAIKNENLKEFLEKLNVTDTTNIPDEIDFSEIEKNIKFTKEEKEQLKEIYSPVLKEQLTKNNFTGMKKSDGEEYVLQLNGEQIKNLIVKLLEATKQNTLLIDKLNEYISQINEDNSDITLTTENVDNMISSINDVDGSEIQNLKITLVQKNKKLNKIECEYGDNKLTVTKINENDKLSYNVNLEIKNTQTTTDEQDSTDDSDNDNSISYNTSVMSDMQLNLYMNIQYTGLQELNNVQEESQVGIALKEDDQNFKYEYNINNNVQFKDDVSIEEFDDKSTVILNNYNSRVLTNFMTQVLQRIVDVNKKQMQELGLEETENPILYSNPITILGIMIYRSSQSVVNDNAVDNLAKSEAEAYNQQFSHYKGDKKRGTEVNALITYVISKNLENEDNKKIEIKLDGNTIVSKEDKSAKAQADTSKLYNVTMEKSEDGYITEIIITEKD